jgi:hypothetical protein
MTTKGQWGGSTTGHTTRLQPHEQLLVGWMVGGTMTAMKRGGGDDGEEGTTTTMREDDNEEGTMMVTRG